jgi:methyl-accepting chemotaxis protein
MVGPSFLAGGRSRFPLHPPSWPKILGKQVVELARLEELVDAFLVAAEGLEDMPTRLSDMLAASDELDSAANEGVRMTERASLANLEGTSGRLSYSMILSGLVLCIAGWRIARGLARPAQETMACAQALPAGDLSHRVDVTSQDEVGATGAALNQAMDAISTALGTQKTDWDELAEKVAKGARLEGMVEQSPVPMMAADKDLVVTYCNRAAMMVLERNQHLMPVPVEKIVGTNIDVFHKDPSLQRRILGNPSNMPLSVEVQLGDDLLAQETSALYDVNGDYDGPMVAWRIVTKERALDERLDDIVSNVVACAEELRASAQELFTGSEEAAQVAQATLGRSQDVQSGNTAVSAATAEMTSTVSSIAQSSRDLADSADRAVAASEAANKVVKTLMDANSQISRVTETISSIADQTNLLALNATIEAAGAGEAGRGFAVVASEVKDLARETMQATGSINNQVKDIHGRSEQVATAIEEIDGVIRSVNELAATLATAVEEQDITTREISDSIVRSAENSDVIAKDMDRVSVSAEQSNQAARSVLEAADQLRDLAGQLSEAKAS